MTGVGLIQFAYRNAKIQGRKVGFKMPEQAVQEVAATHQKFLMCCRDFLNRLFRHLKPYFSALDFCVAVSELDEADSCHVLRFSYTKQHAQAEKKPSKMKKIFNFFWE